MSDEKNIISKFLSSALALIPEDMRELAGFWVGFATMMAAMYFMIMLPSIMINLTKPTKPCWEITEINQIPHRLNKCTGEIEALDSDINQK